MATDERSGAEYWKYVEHLGLTDSVPFLLHPRGCGTGSLHDTVCVNAFSGTQVIPGFCFCNPWETFPYIS